MTFILTKKPTFTAPVKATIAGDGGKTQKVTFTVVFKALPKHEVDDLLQAIREASKEGSEKPLKDRDIVDKVLHGFGADLLQEDQTPMPFTPENVDAVCSIWGLEAAIVKSFFENYVSAPQKN